MKKLILPSMLALSLIATAQFSDLNSNPIEENLLPNSELELTIENLPSHYAGEEEQEATFDFSIAEYLPNNFDVYQGMISDESYQLVTEEIPFDFNVESYLPESFDAYKGMIIEEELVTEEIPFDFNVEAFLPETFDAYDGMIIEEEIVREEIPFDFDIEAYLPVGFDPNKKVDNNHL